MSVGEKMLAAGPDADSGGGKQARFDRCFSGLDFAMDAGPLKDLDPEKLKKEIKRWAKAVVAYARQLSFGPRERPDSQRGSSTD
ncbi:uncharacterized protein LOC109717421 [Ananas comosus]|uniref:Uncharacterized protein LOC109717421 n=1 Tax=Ananas comosus TaxID=4615 RepID=A0A6P5FSZ3_ANACO|nr:uncharacterized protein LOC109717421 [Ananas comosus]